MSQDAQFSLWYLLIAFFTLVVLQVYFTVTPEGEGQTRGRSRRRYGRTGERAWALKKRWKTAANQRLGYALGPVPLPAAGRDGGCLKGWGIRE
jgi:hypothetical protein